MTTAPARATRRRLILPLALAGAAGLAALIFHRPLVAWFTGAPMRAGGGATTTVSAGELTLGLATEPATVAERGNTAIVEVRDPSGAPVADVTLTAEYVMAAMGAMAEMRGPLAITPDGPGRFRGRFDLPMPGTWTLELHARSAGHAITGRFTITVGSAELTALGASASDGAGTASGDDVTVTPARRGQLGIRTSKITRAPMTIHVRAVGRLAYDETRLKDVSLKVQGWVVHLQVGATGQAVAKGEPLLSIYSPELYAAEQEYLLARARHASAATVGDHGDALLVAAEQKLRLLGESERQLADLAVRGTPAREVDVPSPASGYVIEKNVVEGAAVEPGARLYRIAALDKVWALAEVYEADLARIQVGQAATVRLPYLEGKTYAGTVGFIYPYLDPATRTGRIRIALANPALELKPDMYADVDLALDLGPRLQAPISAVIYTGPRRLVFVDRGDGTLHPVEVTLGARTDDLVEITGGLADGDTVVTEGTFLIAAESRLRTSSALWSGGDAPR